MTAVHPRTAIIQYLLVFLARRREASDGSAGNDILLIVAMDSDHLGYSVQFNKIATYLKKTATHLIINGCDSEDNEHHH